MRTSAFRAVVSSLTLMTFLLSGLVVGRYPASAQSQLLQQQQQQPQIPLPLPQPGVQSGPFQLPSQDLGPLQLPSNQPMPGTQQGPPPPSAPRRAVATTNRCPAGWPLQVATTPRSPRHPGGLQTVRATPGRSEAERFAAGKEADLVEPVDELSSIEVAFQSSIDAFLRFSNVPGLSARQAFTPESAPLPRPDAPRQPQATIPAPVGARQLQDRIQALELKLQELTEIQESHSRPTTPFGVRSPATPGEFDRGGEPPVTYDPFSIPLRQYGYSLFSTNVSTFAPVDDIPVGPDYIIGPGDDLMITVWGPTDSFMVRTVDRSGRIVLPKIGDLRVWGLTFSQADRLIREQLARYFRGYQTSVTMGRLRTIRVHVVGEVCQPGSYVLSSLSTLTAALFGAGGPTKLGSLRDVRLMRNGRLIGSLDLYDFLQRGDRTRDYRLESGDTVFVPTVGEVAAVVGEVKRPAIYELRGEVRVADLVELGGGVTPSSYLRRVQIVRSLPSAERVTIDVDLAGYYLRRDAESNPPVNGGDLVLIHRSDPRIYNTVKVEGAVKYPGVYELKPMMRLSQLLPTERLLPEAALERVEIARRRADFSLEILQVSLKKAWSGVAEQDPLLKPLDEVTVRSELREAGSVTLTGQVVRPGKYTISPGERLSSVLERAGGFTDRAHLKGAVFTRASLRKVEQEHLDVFLRTQEQRILSAASTVVVGGDREETAVSGGTIQARLELLRALAKRVAVGRMVVRLAPPETLKSGGDDVVLLDGDSLDVPEPSASVLVVGAVRNSTSVAYVPNASVDFYLNRVGGLSKDADKNDIHLVRADGSTLSGFSNVRTVEPGDTVVVPPREDVKIRVVPTIRDAFAILGSTLQTVLSAAALAVLF
jgi:protein involved in polysaccharide export with SLBB domain